MIRLLTSLLLLLALTAPVMAKDKPQPLDSAPLRYGMELSAAEEVIADAAMWRTAYRIDTETTCELAAIWSGSVYYHLKFLDAKCCYVEKRAEVGPQEVEQLLQMYRAVYGDSPEASSSQDGRLIFSRWVLPEREVTISAVGRHGRYKLFYEEFDPVGIGEVRVAQERELGQTSSTDPLTGRTRIDPLGQAADKGKVADSGEEPTGKAETSADAEAEEEKPTDKESKPEPKKSSKQEDPGDW
ncbi:MAG: hypothetical protein M3R04_00040 [bacterium]|nr:hypothetical protein [bacterium]